MPAKLFDIVSSLIDITSDETVRLRAPAPLAERAEIAAAKARLVSQLEVRIVELNRASEGGLEALDAGERQTLAQLFARLEAVTTENGEALRRQIDLSTEMMAAIAAEAQRLSGTRSATYSARGGIATRESQAPISLNARL